MQKIDEVDSGESDDSSSKGSSSVDVARGFEDSSDEAAHVRALDEETHESEDWADRDLRELRAAPSALPPNRRQTLNGIDVAPRSELSPPLVTPDSAAAVADEMGGTVKGRGLLGKFKSNSAINKVSSGDSFFVENSGSSKKGTFSRISSKLREKKKNNQQNQLGARKSSSDLFNKSAADSINDSLAVMSTPESVSGKSSLRGAPPAHSPSQPDNSMRNGQELFRFVLEHALDPDEKVLQSYVFTLAYFADPVHVLSDLITEHDVAVASISSTLAADADGEEVVCPNAERAMKVISFWVSHVWYQFEGSEPLMNLLTHFVKVNLKGKRWGNRLSDTIDTLVEGRKALHRTLDALMAHGKGLASRDDLFSEVDPDDQEDVGLNLDDDDEEDEEEEEPTDSGRIGLERDSSGASEDILPKEDVTSTFVGAETYTDKSRPMGLADLLGEVSLGDKPEPPSSAAAAAAAAAVPAPSAKRGVAATMVGAHKYNPSSRPMGLFGLLEGAEETPSSIWDGHGRPESLNLAEDAASNRGRAGVRASDIAKQLTMIECVFWKLVSPLELQRALWKNESEERGNYVRQVIGWHNRVASWVQYEVLSRGTNIGERVKAVQRFLTICLHLEKLQNFHSLFGIMAGLKVGNVVRLRIEQDLSPSWCRIYTRFAELASTRNNWEVYRAVKNHATKFPFFPFLGVYLQDLQVLEAKEKTFVGDDMSSRLINFGKMQKLGALLKELVYVQRGSEYSFRHNSRVLAYLLSLKQLSDDELWEMSCRIVPSAGEFEPHNRPSDRSFLAATLSPRGMPSSSMEGLSAQVREGNTRQRSASIGEALRVWKPKSEPASRSGSTSPRSPRSRNESTGHRGDVVGAAARIIKEK